MKTCALLLITPLLLALGLGSGCGKSQPAEETQSVLSQPTNATSAASSTTVHTGSLNNSETTVNNTTVQLNTNTRNYEGSTSTVTTTQTAVDAPVVQISQSTQHTPAPTLPPPVLTTGSHAPALRTFAAKPGSKVRIEGTSTLHDWQVEGKLIGGSLTAPENFPAAMVPEPGTGRFPAGAEVFIPIRSMVSLKKDGSPYSTAMDDIMYEKLKAQEHPRIFFRLAELMPVEAGATAEAVHRFEARGELAVAGVTNRISMPVTVQAMPNNLLKVSGAVGVKMTDFKITPPEPTVIPIKTGDEVKLSFEWVVAKGTTK
jgi:hypothetical protein